MKQPSRRLYELAILEAELAAKQTELLEQARAAADTSVIAAELEALYNEVAAKEAEGDQYLCIQCGTEFSTGAHADIYAASLLMFEDDWEDVARHDFGLPNPDDPEATFKGRRFKICGTCLSGWAYQPDDYILIR